MIFSAIRVKVWVHVSFLKFPVLAVLDASDVVEHSWGECVSKKHPVSRAAVSIFEFYKFFFCVYLDNFANVRTKSCNIIRMSLKENFKLRFPNSSSIKTIYHQDCCDLTTERRSTCFPTRHPPPTPGAPSHPVESPLAKS